MPPTTNDTTLWPALPYEAWKDTYATLHLWTQIIGKVRLSLTPWVNHSWQVPLYVTARGLGTGPVPFGKEIFEIEFDFVSHRLRARTSQGEERMFAMEPQSVAAFYSRAIDLLSGVGVAVSINEMPNELPTAPMPPMMPPRRIASGVRWCRWTVYSNSFEAASSAK